MKPTKFIFPIVLLLLIVILIYSISKPRLTYHSQIVPATTNIDVAEEKGKELYKFLKESNWKYDPTIVPYDLLFLTQDKTTSSWIIPKDIPEQGNIACYTDIFVGEDNKYYSNESFSIKKTGFYLVVFKNGNISKIPVDKVKLVTTDNHTVQVFPNS